jgi:hypothetical protein
MLLLIYIYINNIYIYIYIMNMKTTLYPDQVGQFLEINAATGYRSGSIDFQELPDLVQVILKTRTFVLWEYRN